MTLRPLALAAVLVVTAPALAQRLDTTPTYPDDLAVGPFEARLSARIDAATAIKPAPRSVEVQYVLRDKVAFREYIPDPAAPGGRRTGFVDVLPAAKVVSVVVLRPDGKEDGARTWTFDAQAARLRGPVEPKPPVVPAPRPWNKAGMAAYLIVRAEYLHRGLNNSIAADLPTAVKRDLRAAADVREAVADLGFPPALVGLFALDGYAAEQQQTRADMKAASKQSEKAALDAQADRNAVNKTAGLMKLLGGLTAAAGTYGAFKAKTESGADFGGRAAGAGAELFLEAAAAQQYDLAKIAATEQYLQGEARNAFRTANARGTAGRAALEKQREAAAAAAGLDVALLVRFDQLADDMFRRGDVRAAVSVLKRRAAAVERAGGVPNPLLVAEIAHLEAGLIAVGATDAKDRAARAADVFALARAVPDGLDAIPPGRAFDADRVSVLTSAAGLVHQAVSLQHGPVDWSDCWSPRADYGLRLADRALGYGPELDPDGAVRAVRAWLLFQRGLTEAAVRQGAEVGPMREWDPDTQYNLARVYGRAERGGATQPTFQYLEKSLRAGFYDIASANKDKDVKLNKALQPRWADLSRPSAEAVVESVQDPATRRFTYHLWLANRSAYPLRDLTLAYSPTFNGPGNRPVSGGRVTAVVPYIPVGGVHVWPAAVTGIDLRPSVLTIQSPYLPPPVGSLLVGFGPVTYNRSQFYFGF